MSTDNERARQGDAATDLEELALAMRGAVSELRLGQTPARAYALVYELRWRLGKVVASLGSDVPDSEARSWARGIVDSHIWNG